MLIANESHWMTEDLEALLEYVLGIQGVRDKAPPADTLLLFRTGNWRKGSWPEKSFHNPEPAACCFREEKIWSRTVVINIRSKTKLKVDVLDQMSQIRAGFKQDMPSECVEDVAKSIGYAVANYDGLKLNYSWARTKSLRTRDRGGKSKEAKRRQILALQIKRDELRRITHNQIRDIESRIDFLKRGL